MLLHFSDRRNFATGASRYLYEPATQGENTNRILVRVDFEGILTEAVLDTGAPYVVCTPWLARALGFVPSAALERTRILIRGHWTSGEIHRVTLTFPGERGEKLILDATAFVPDAASDPEEQPFPSFIGLAGCLERMRFAIDPLDDMFYFGALNQD
mgnify:CR=1 FL=1